MRSINGLAAICRAVEGVAAASSVAGNPVRHHHHHRLFEAALYSTTANNSSSSRSRWFSRICANHSARTTASAVTGVVLLSLAATALGEEVQAKEPVQSEFRPEEVVLYQYEACPFCNKVKGTAFASRFQYILMIEGMQFYDFSVILNWIGNIVICFILRVWSLPFLYQRQWYSIRVSPSVYSDDIMVHNLCVLLFEKWNCIVLVNYVSFAISIYMVALGS